MLVLELNSSWRTPRMSNSDKKSARLLKFHGPPTKKWSCDIWFTLSVIHVDETTVSKLVWILLISSLFLLGLCSDPSTGCNNQEVVGASQLLVHCAHVHLVCLHCVILFQKDTSKKESLSMFCAKSVVNIERIQHHRAVGSDWFDVCTLSFFLSSPSGGPGAFCAQFFRDIRSQRFGFLVVWILAIPRILQLESIGSRTQIYL